MGTNEQASGPGPQIDLADARRCYGLGTGAWSSAGRFQVEDDWWIALSGTRYVDYNLALLHGPTATEMAPRLIGEIAAAKVPSLIMLASAGLGAAGPLREAGWVCTSAMPFMAKSGGTVTDDPAVRPLSSRELPAARAIAAAAFGVPEEVGAIVYSDAVLEREDCMVLGLFEDGELTCCSFGQWVAGRYNVGWALATAPDNQRSGFGRRLIRAGAYHRTHNGGPPTAIATATPVAEHLYLEEGFVTLEYWQVWSRPRWVLPN